MWPFKRKPEPPRDVPAEAKLDQAPPEVADEEPTEGPSHTEYLHPGGETGLRDAPDEGDA